MPRFKRLDSQIRANRLILADRFRVPELNPFFANCAWGAKELRIAGLRRFALRIAGPSKLPQVVFARGCEFPLVFLGEGCGVGFRGVGGGVGVGTGKGTGKSMRAFARTTL